MIRSATVDDAQAISTIYEPYVEHTAVTFELAAPTAEDFATRILSYSSCFPFLVYERENEVIGYAYASKYHERAAYRHTVTVSIYLSQACHGQGIGSTLYSKLLDTLKEQGIHVCLAQIALPNDKSIAMHRKFDFVEVGILREVGYKFDRWHDVMLMQKIL